MSKERYRITIEITSEETLDLADILEAAEPTAEALRRELQALGIEIFEVEVDGNATSVEAVKPKPTGKRPRVFKFCSVDDCSGESVLNGLCKKHQGFAI